MSASGIMPRLRRVLWIADYFPRPHQMTDGVWGLETVRELARQGLEVVVLAPTPWIPRWLAWTPGLSAWSKVPQRWAIDGIPVCYPRCPHYPHRWIARFLYQPLPWFEAGFLWPWCARTVAQIADRCPFQVVHANFVFPSGAIGLAIKRRYGMPLVVQERSMTRLMAARRQPLRRRLYARILRGADLVVTGNRRMAHLLSALRADGRPVQAMRDASRSRRDSGGPGTGTIRVVPSGCALNEAAPAGAQRPRRYQGKAVVLSVGSLIERKGHAYLVRAIQALADEFPHLRCLIIGDGARFRPLARLVRRLGLDEHVELWGRRSHEEVLRTMAWCDVFALPSWDEPFGTVYAEAMACAKPVIACAGEGVGELLQDGAQGLLVNRQDVTSLVEALRRLLREPGLAAWMGLQGRRLAERELSYQAIARRLNAGYDALVR